MVRAILAVVLAVGLVSLPCGATGQEKTKAKPAADPVAKMLSTLHNQRVQWEMNLNEVPLMEILMNLSKRYDIPFVIRDEAFKEEGVPNIRDMKPNLSTTRLDGLSVHRFLTLVLRDLNAVYMVRDGYIEITTRTDAQKEVGLLEAIETAANNSDDPNASVRTGYRMNLPLVSVAVENQPLDVVITSLARAYGLNVVIHPEARKLMKGAMVSERLLNVPADDALEVLAGLAGLDVARKGNTFRIGFGAAGMA